MLTAAHERLVKFIEQSKVPFQHLKHSPCRTSVESAAARSSAGAPNSVGAKALIIKIATSGNFAMVVLPGGARLANDSVRRIFGKFRFANPEEIARVTDGLAPGMIPPFISPVFPELHQLVIDEGISSEPLIGFNAAHLERSIVMTGCDYVSLVNPIAVTSVSTGAKSDTSVDLAL